MAAIERYFEVADEVRRTVAKRMAEKAEDPAKRYAEAERATLARFMEKLPEMSERDLSTAVRNLAVSRGVSTDKGQVLRGEPTAVVAQHSSPAQAIATLQRLGLLVADEPVDAEVVALPRPERRAVGRQWRPANAKAARRGQEARF